MKLVKKNLHLRWFECGIILKSLEKNDVVCLFAELFAEMVLMVYVSDGFEDKIMKKVVFID